MPRLSLSFLGPFQVTLDGVPVTRFESVKVRALLAYLAVEVDRPHPREVLAGLLWPDWPDTSALSNLRYALADLRGCLKDRDATPSFLLVSRESLQFNPAGDHALDVQAFEAALAGKADLPTLEEAVVLYRGPFLDGFSVSESAPFEQWMLRKREGLERQALATLRSLAAYHEHQGAYAQAEAHARRHVELAPEDEAGHQLLMRALAMSGQRSAALAQYETCRRVLAEELGVQPSRDTTALYVQIRDEIFSAPATAQPTGPRDLPPFPGAERQPVEVERPPVVARERELARLEHLLAKAFEGQGQVAFVVGDPGMGKTTLLGEFVRRAVASHPDLVVAQGNGNAYTGVGDPYLPFLEVLQMLTGDIEARWAGGSLTREHAQRLWALVPETVQALLEEGPELIGCFVPGPALLARARAFAPAGGVSQPVPWLTRLEQLLQNKPPTPLQKELFERTTRVLQALARQHPLLLVLDDLQWADEPSLNLLFHLGRKLAGQRILIVGAYRSGEVALGRGGQRHPLEPVASEFRRSWGEIMVDLAAAQGRQFVDDLVDSEPNHLGEGFRETLFHQTGGHALFTVELLRGLKERGDLRHDVESCWVEGPSLDWAQLPARVEAVVDESIQRLPAEERELLALASVEGEGFHAQVLARVQGVDHRAVIRVLSGALSEQHRLVSAVSVQRGGRRLSRYRFRNYLFQRRLYEGLDEVQRADLHEQVGLALEALYGGAPCAEDELGAYLLNQKLCQTWELPAVAEVAPQLSRHFEFAALPGKAVLYLYLAGGRAASVVAPQQAAEHWAHAVRVLQTEPDTPARAAQECVLELFLKDCYTLLYSWGAPQVQQAAQRACDLALRSGQGHLRAISLVKLGGAYFGQGKYELAQRLWQQVLEPESSIPQLGTLLRFDLGMLALWRGQFALARQWMDSVLAPYVSPQASVGSQVPPGSPGLDDTSKAIPLLWVLGYPDRARRMLQSHEAALTAPISAEQHASILWHCGLTHQFFGDVPAVLQRLEEALPLVAQVPAVRAHVLVGVGWARAHSGRVEEGIANMREGVAACQTAASESRLSQFMALLAQGYLCAGRPDEGLEAIAAALGYVENNDERHYEAEIYRIKGELLLKDASTRRRDAMETGAEECFLKAIAVARGQEAKSWELRATISLVRLWQKQDKVAQAREMLASIYGWFTEGFDTPDLVEARELLAEMAQQNGAPQ